MHHLGAVDLREGDKVFRTAAGEAVLALDREDDVLMRRGKRRLGVAHAVVDLIPNDLALDVEARDLHRVDEGLLHVPAGKADQAAVPGLAGLEHAEGVVEEPNEGEDRILVKSPKVATYDLKPEMSAYEVCDKLVAAIKSDKYDVIVINFANPDMVGHTGVIEAAVKAIEAVDECVGKAYEALKEADGQMFICADHGNAEYMIDEETKEPFTAHTTNPVPFILVNADPAYKLKEDGCLADIAPTLIELMGMEQPAEMTGTSLLVK